MPEPTTVRMKRFSKSMLMAGGLTIAVIVWMLTGIGKDANPTQDTSRVALSDAANLPPRVSVQISRAQPITREIVVSARTEPNRIVELRAETDGRVVALGAERGSAVASGERIVGLDM